MPSQFYDSLKYTLLSCGVASLLAVSSFGQTAIGINLSGSATYDLVPTDSVGVVSTANWNNLNPASSNETFNTINDQNGVATGASVQITQSQFNYLNSTSIAGGVDDPPLPDALMMGSTKGTSSNGNSRTIAVTNSPYALVDVYIYFGGAGTSATIPYTMNVRLQGPDGIGGWTDVSPTYYMVDTDRRWSGIYERSIATSSGDAGAQEKNYVLFENVALSDFRVTASSIGRRAGFSGLQVVAVPEPSAVALILGGVVGVIAYWRRRSKS